VAVLLTRFAEAGRRSGAGNGCTCCGAIKPSSAPTRPPGRATRYPYLAAHAYLLGSFTEFHRLGSFQRLTLCWRIFGRDRVTGEIARLRAVLARWGYQLGRDDDSLLPLVASQLFLFNRSPHLEDLSTDLLNRFRTERLIEGARLNTLYALQRAVAELGFCDPPHHRIGAHSPRATGGAAIWEQWVDRWHATLDRMTVGDYVQRTAGLGDRIGKPLGAPSKERQLAALRRFFSDCQAWEWLPRRFDPRRALATPRSIAALLGPNPG
jgi:hypothetical protein